jgi:hypothetical protein
MPLTPKGKKILKSMTKTYGAKKAKQVFYASINEGKITGAEGTKKKKKSKSKKRK